MHKFGTNISNSIKELFQRPRNEAKGCQQVYGTMVRVDSHLKCRKVASKVGQLLLNTKSEARTALCSLLTSIISQKNKNRCCVLGIESVKCDYSGVSLHNFISLSLSPSPSPALSLSPAPRGLFEAPTVVGHGWSQNS